MSKRTLVGTVPRWPRKRKRKGLSMRTELLEPTEVASSQTPLMSVRYSTVENPSTVRKSVVPVLRESQNQDVGIMTGDVDFAAVESPSNPSPERTRQRKNDSTKMETWASVRSRILDEILRHDGLQEDASPPQCASCADDVGVYRCRDCVALLYCASCIVCRHESLPLHRLEFWNGGFFQRASLKELGHCFYLGHQYTPCPSSAKTEALTVVDSNGIHDVTVQYCACEEILHSVERYCQLLRAGWYPASFKKPRTAFTFDVLDSYHKVALQGKLNLYDFYSSIRQKSDNCGRRNVVNRYHEMSRAVRQWRQLKQLKRGGGGHTAKGLASIEYGALALECPACPQPGRNLPPDWDKGPEEKQWLYRLFLAIDANFRLKLKNRGINDPELGSGWAYFVEIMRYKNHVSQKFTATEAVGCGSDFHAVGQANTKSSKGYIASGVVACVCARHSLMQKNGVGDLQVGERYINTDYIVGSVLKDLAVRDVVISYDIACKWSIHHLERIRDHLPDLDVDHLQLTYLIPKFHLPGHGTSCQVDYSFNYAKGVGRTHGETVEQGWANMNLAALSTREMGPGARHLTLDDMWSGWNWAKTLGMGNLLLRNLLRAIFMKAKHASANKKFDATLPEKLHQEWLAMIRNWESDRSRPNPYTHTEKASSLAETRRRLAEADREELQRGTASPQVPASIFIRNGLELEEQQRQLASAVKTSSPKSDHQIASIQEKRNGLMRQIKKWQALQLAHMPGAGSALTQMLDHDAEDEDVELAENVPLLLPSSLDPVSRDAHCPQQVTEYERLFRMAQVQDSLVELRHSRKIRRKLLLNHFMQIAGQGVRANTRSRGVLESVESRITKFVERYRLAYQALVNLDPKGSWRETFLELNDCDNRGPGKEHEEEGLGDGEYLRSWIWLSNPQVPDTAGDTVREEVATEDDVADVLRVEWTTSFARHERWAEEVELLQEEMRRVVMFLEWRSKDWLAKEGVRPDVTPDIESGLRAYARKQASIFHDLAMSFAKLWYPTLKSYGLQHLWAADYMTDHGVSPTDAKVPFVTRGIFKFRLAEKSQTSPSAEQRATTSTTNAAVDNITPPEGTCPGQDDSSDESDSDFELDLEDDLDL